MALTSFKYSRSVFFLANMFHTELSINTKTQTDFKFTVTYHVFVLYTPELM